jgi:hypothetical protein
MVFAEQVGDVFQYLAKRQVVMGCQLPECTADKLLFIERNMSDFEQYIEIMLYYFFI